MHKAKGRAETVGHRGNKVNGWAYNWKPGATARRNAAGQDGKRLDEKGNDMMKRTFLALSFGVGACLAATAPVNAQTRNCAERDTVVERLSDGYGESRQSIGMGANNSVVEVFASLETGTWTITVTMPNGITCLVASGQSFERLEEELTPAGIRL